MWHTKLRAAHGKIKQAYGTLIDSEGSNCALGAIFGVTDIGATGKIYGVIHADITPVSSCSVCAGTSFYPYGTLTGLIMHLNDIHGFNFKEIANYIQPIEEEHFVNPYIELEDPSTDESDVVYATAGNK